MNVVEPKLLPQDYPRANHLKTEVEHARRYIASLDADSPKRQLLAGFFAEAAYDFDLLVPGPK